MANIKFVLMSVRLHLETTFLLSSSSSNWNKKYNRLHVALRLQFVYVCSNITLTATKKKKSKEKKASGCCCEPYNHHQEMGRMDTHMQKHQVVALFCFKLSGF